MYQAEWLIYRRRKPRQRRVSLNVSMYMILPSIELADTQYDINVEIKYEEEVWPREEEIRPDVGIDVRIT